MFDNLHHHAKLLHGEMVGVFWIILPCLVTFLIVLEILRNDDNGPNVAEILKRTTQCVFLLWSFDFVINVVAVLSDGVTERLKDSTDLWQALKQLGPNASSKSGSMFDLREHILYFFAITSYLVAYIGFFASTALVNFVWAILYVTAPLILPCFIARTTAPIVGNLYRGLISVATWKILWTLLGSLLLKMALDPKVVGIEDYFLSMVMNLLIGMSMLLIPFFAKSLISDGLQSASSALAASPGFLAAKSATSGAKKIGKNALRKGMEGAQFAARPVTNPLSSRAKILSDKFKLKERFNKAKKHYGELGMPKDLKGQNKYALRNRELLRHSGLTIPRKGVKRRVTRKRK